MQLFEFIEHNPGSYIDSLLCAMTGYVELAVHNILWQCNMAVQYINWQCNILYTSAVLKLECSIDCISGSPTKYFAFIFALSAFLLKKNKIQNNLI